MSVRSPVCLKRYTNENTSLRLFRWLVMYAWTSGVRWTAFWWYDMASEMSARSQARSKRPWYTIPRLQACMRHGLQVCEWDEVLSADIIWSLWKCRRDLLLVWSDDNDSSSIAFNRLDMSEWPWVVRWTADSLARMQLSISSFLFILQRKLLRKPTPQLSRRPALAGMLSESSRTILNISLIPSASVTA